MNALDLNGEDVHVYETIINAKNATDYDYTWKVKTPYPHSLLPFVQISLMFLWFNIVGGSLL